VGYGNQKMINTLYQYKYKQDIDEVDMTTECKKDYKDNKK